MKIILSLGSNLGDRWAYLRAAVAALKQVPHVQVLAVSGVYETPPWGDSSVPAPPYLNACALLDAACTADVVLGACLGIEAALGRQRDSANPYAPRMIDLDVLFACEGEFVAVQNDKQLTLPHPRLAQRAFALKPAIALWSHPQLQAWFARPEVQADAAAVRLLEGNL